MAWYFPQPKFRSRPLVPLLEGLWWLPTDTRTKFRALHVALQAFMNFPCPTLLLPLSPPRASLLWLDPVPWHQHPFCLFHWNLGPFLAPKFMCQGSQLRSMCTCTCTHTILCVHALVNMSVLIFGRYTSCDHETSYTNLDVPIPEYNTQHRTAHRNCSGVNR